MKKIISAFMAAVMMLGLLSVSSSAFYGTVSGTDDVYHNAVTEKFDFDDVYYVGQKSIPDDAAVYISISSDGDYAVSPVDKKTVMWRVPVRLKDLAAYSLVDYGIDEDYVYEYDGKELVTLLNLYCYVLENYYGEGSAAELQLTGAIVSTYMKNGFWGHDENLTYYVNAIYPLMMKSTGATCGTIVLEDGDYIDLQMYTDWNFYSDEAAGYHYFLKGGSSQPYTADDIVFEYTVRTGESLKLVTGKAWGNIDQGEETEIEACADSVYYGPSYVPLASAASAQKLNGDTVSFSEPGTYYAWVYGEKNKDGNYVSAPAMVRINVEAESPAVQYGDVNGDDTVNATDAALLYAYIKGKVAIADAGLAAADLNGDKSVNATDAALLYAYIKGKISVFPVNNK